MTIAERGAPRHIESALQGALVEAAKNLDGIKTSLEEVASKYMLSIAHHGAAEGRRNLGVPLVEISWGNKTLFYSVRHASYVYLAVSDLPSYETPAEDVLENHLTLIANSQQTMFVPAIRRIEVFTRGTEAKIRLIEFGHVQALENNRLVESRFEFLNGGVVRVRQEVVRDTYFYSDQPRGQAFQFSIDRGGFKALVGCKAKQGNGMLAPVTRLNEVGEIATAIIKVSLFQPAICA